jgi:hypothetical protein
MKSTLFILFVTGMQLLIAQETNYTRLTGKYLGQPEPGIKPELFAEGLVSVGEGVHGNIVFTPDLLEAAWHPNYKVNGRSVIYLMRYRYGKWEPPAEFFLTSGSQFSEPYYSFDGNKLYFLAGKVGKSGYPEFERICYAEREKNGWSDQKLLSHMFDTIPTHWQFSLDKESNLYFSTGVYDHNAQIYCSRFRNGQYTRPDKLSENINTELMEFSPCISPNNDYLIFTRSIQGKNKPPKMNLYISFRDKEGQWMQAQNLSDKLGMATGSPYYMMSAARVSPDGKYLFFTFFNGTGHMVYWVNAGILEDLRPE